MSMFRKHPVIIEARQFTKADGAEVATWCGGEFVEWPMAPESPQIKVATLEGEMRAEVNNWIIKGVNGEFYPCRQDIFEKTYEPVEG